MTSTTESCIELTASDGVLLAVWVDGIGPPLVFVHGSLQDHTANRTLVDELVGDLTTYSIDQRGFGASGDAASWSLDRDFEDVPRERREVPPGGVRGRARGPKRSPPDAQSVEDLTALLTSVGER